MYIRKNTRTYKGTVYTNYLLVESVSTPKGPRQRTICSLGNLRPRHREEWLKLAHKAEQALVGREGLFASDDPEIRKIVATVTNRQQKAPAAQGEQQGSAETAHPDSDLVAVHTNRVTTERPREAGPVHVGYQYWQKLKFDDILGQAGLRPRARALTCAMVMNRLVYPCSEYAMPDWIRRTALEDILQMDCGTLAEDALYRNMDRLYPRRALIESRLSEHEQTLFNLDLTVVLYDLTSTYFEGLALANPKAKRGYSRDKRPDCKQVVVGLAINQDGFPRAHEVFEGNVQDHQTLKTMLDLLAQRVGLKDGQTVVVDRGMAYEENLKEIRSRHLHYVVAARQAERDQWQRGVSGGGRSS